MKAIAVFTGNLQGFVSFAQKNRKSSVIIEGEIHNLSPGLHGFHVHTYGNLLSTDCQSCGGHWNPTGAQHGGLDTFDSHAGDFGNISANKQGVAKFSFDTDKVTLCGKYSIVGRSIVIHAQQDARKKST